MSDDLELITGINGFEIEIYELLWDYINNETQHFFPGDVADALRRLAEEWDERWQGEDLDGRGTE